MASTKNLLHVKVGISSLRKRALKIHIKRYTTPLQISQKDLLKKPNKSERVQYDNAGPRLVPTVAGEERATVVRLHVRCMLQVTGRLSLASPQ